MSNFQHPALPLADGWAEHPSKTYGGTPYYFHAATGTTRWERPQGRARAAPRPAAAPRAGGGGGAYVPPHMRKAAPAAAQRPGQHAVRGASQADKAFARDAGAKGYREYGPDSSLQSVDEDGMVLRHAKSGIGIYYQDRSKKYRFITDATGLELLHAMTQRNSPVLALNDKLLDTRGAGTAAKMRSEGRALCVLLLLLLLLLLLRPSPQSTHPALQGTRRSRPCTRRAA